MEVGGGARKGCLTCFVSPQPPGTSHFHVQEDASDREGVDDGVLSFRLGSETTEVVLITRVPPRPERGPHRKNTLDGKGYGISQSPPLANPAECAQNGIP